MKPFVHSVDTPFGKYVYDVNTHTVLELSEKAHSNLQCSQYNDQELQELLVDGYLKDNPIISIKHPFADQIEDILSKTSTI